MPTKSVKRTEGRARLNRERVLRTAVEVADEEGLEKLSMRRLGEGLGVEAMSLYNHVSNKEDLLNGMIDALYGEIELPSHDDDWKTALRKRSVSVREVLLRHPWANGLMDSATSPGPGTLRHHDRVLGTFRNGGFSLAMTAHAFSALDSYVYGYAKQERALPFDNKEQAAAMATGMLVQLPASDYPYLHELMAKHVLQPGYNYADEFSFGLDLVLDALERARDAERAG
ncbi:AcrR family transcriptional regulator [Pseudarthrobacter defluvii]|uniref:AcrR family transcriptional regulator n=1 Tax=Pseudarthrobacter defluvii TaxID=410837 RepID=A0ABT9UPF2_9MICC|nr:TetR/AcrR family transcriptional regulator [Pseudarthrobacter defluvii]MDQ0121001.1 AcrR family transcriptional regulator [Pseudarthrobacter defluvii]